MAPSSLAQWFAAIATSAAVIVALFGDFLKAKLFTPHLELSLPNPRGELTTEVTPLGTGLTNQVNARYYHVRVSNRWRWPVAKDVQIVLVRLEDIGPSGARRIIWASDDGVPLRWRLQEIHPLSRIVGRRADADLCSARETGSLTLHPMITPNNLPVSRTGRTDIYLSLQARSNEVESQILSVRISWDGLWNAGETEMAAHLVVSTC